MTERRYVGAIDQGTTSSRFVVFDIEGRIVSMHQIEHKQIYPQPAWVEHDPLEIWEKTREAISQALIRGNIRPEELAAIGVTNQRETTVVWDPETGRPYANAIVWQDTRTAGICKELSEGGGADRFREKVGLPIHPYFSGTKLKWILDNIPGVREAAEKGRALFGNIDTWLIWQLTGQHITDVTNASRTMLMNLETLDWDPDMLDVFSVPANMLPTIKSSSEIYGYTSEDGVFKARIPVAGDLGDQQAALFGQACFEEGQAKNTYGTGCFLLKNVGHRIVPSKSGLLTTLGYKIGQEPAVYALEGSVAITGSLVQWVRDNMGLIKESKDIEALAASVEDSGGIYFVPAFSGLYAPYWRSDARGLIIGLTHYINKGHLARAVLEATAYQTKEIFEAMMKDSGIKLTSLKVDGGMVRNELLMQFQSDILGVEVIRPAVTETTVLGAAYAAGFAVGFWKSKQELVDNWRIDKTWQPKMSGETRTTLYQGWQKAVKRTFDWQQV